MKYYIPQSVLALALTTLLSACGGGGGGNGTANGTLSVQITDASVDGVSGVHVQFDGITVKPRDGSQLQFPFSAKTIDLKALDGDNTETLINNQTLPAGEYNWIRLDVNADCDGEWDSFVDQVGGGQIELRVPSARGLQLGNGFVITDNQNTSFVIDWNLRMGLTDPVGSDCYKLKPSLRIVDMTQHGTIAGTIDSSLIGGDVNTLAGNVVYIYEGAGVVPDDIDGIDPDPVTTADVKFNAETGNYEYMAAFLSPMDYTVAFTADGQNDVIPDPDMPEIAADEVITFTPGQTTTVVDGQTSTVSFPAGS